MSSDELNKNNRNINLLEAETIISYEYDFDKEGYSVRDNLQKMDGKPFVILTNILFKKSLLITLDDLPSQEAVMHDIIDSVVNLFKLSTFRHQREIILEIMNKIKFLTELEKDSLSSPYIYDKYGSLDDLVLVEDYICFIYDKYAIEKPNFNEWIE